MTTSKNEMISRRRLFGWLAMAAAAPTALLIVPGEAEAKPGRGQGKAKHGRGIGQPYGWSRGRKVGWRKKGGPKWR